MQEWSPVQVSASTPKRSRTTRWPSPARFASRGSLAALPVQHALALRHDHLRPLLLVVSASRSTSRMAATS